MSRTPVLAAVGVLFVAAVAVLLVAGTPPGIGPDPNPGTDGVPSNDTDFERFASNAEFQTYLERSNELATSRMGLTGGGLELAAGGGDGGTDDARVVEEEASTSAPADGNAGGDGADGGSADARRVSETNVQEAGIDEPDVLKTDGEYAYYTKDQRYRTLEADRAAGDSAGSRDGSTPDGTKVIGLQPPGTAEEVAELGHAGDLLRVDDTLVVFAPDAIYGYDVADPDEPEQVWRTDRESQVVTARLIDGTIYVVFASDLDSDACPVTPVGDDIVRCTDIYRPGSQVPVDVTYTAAALDPESGEVTDTLSFVGSRQSTVYASENGLYVTYTEGTDRNEIAMEFLTTDGRSLLDDDAADRLEEIRSYDLTPQATWIEIEAVLRSQMESMDDAERRAFQEDLTDRFADWADEHRHEFTRTHVVKVGLTDGLDVAATGSVPGVPLNQFSLDEHEGHLRIATTVTPPSMWGDVESTNDVYVLDGNLSQTGAVTGMGENERVYSVRFTGDTGYVVTFRRIDPFHVLDLSDPENPSLEGELKLPGFSDYLHPIDDGRVLGIGEEDGEVKAVIFDVSDPTDPQVLDDAILGDRWSAISESHHAFLIDREHGVFFLPGTEGGHVFSYEDGLEEVYTVQIENPQRAMYLDDYLYVFADDEVVVVDETDWEEVDRLEL